jgi:hypothetical protein
MSENEILTAIEGIWPGPIINQSVWLFAFGETLHFLGLCLLFGSLLVVDLRLLGFARRIPVSAALAFLPFAIVGFLINAVTGWIMFTADPFLYWLNPAFKLKMLLILIAGINALVFTIAEHRPALAIGPNGDTTVFTKVTAGLSLALWAFVLLLGRLLPVTGVGG